MAVTCCTVYLWLPGKTAKSIHKGNIFSHITRHLQDTGHAAMQIGPSPDPTLYVSWWPKETAGFDSLLPGKKYESKPLSYTEDMEAEDSWLPSRYRDEMGRRLEAPVHPGVKVNANIFRYFPTGQATREQIEEQYHQQMLHFALGMRQEELEQVLEMTYCGDHDAFLAAMTQHAAKKLNEGLCYMQSKSHQKILNFNDKTPWVIPLSGLDLLPMIKEWWSIRDKAGAHYRILRKNCATVVHRVLAAGGGDKIAGFKASKTLVWTPSRLASYCQKINKKKGADHQ